MRRMIRPIAIIGGTGVGELPFDEGTRAQGTIATPWGTASFVQGTIASTPVVFLPRHGEGHRTPPHRIAHHAHAAALAHLDVLAVLATAAVGGLRPDLGPGDLLVPDDLIDLRPAAQPCTFFHEQVAHTDFTYPYCPHVRRTLLQTSATLGITPHGSGTYVCTAGPRYETPAEVRLFHQWGGAIVGMTGAPEAILCREAGLPYAAVALVTNSGAGWSAEPLSHDDVVRRMNQSLPRLRQWLCATIATLANNPPDQPSVAASIWDEPEAVAFGKPTVVMRRE
jgi:5'-methylthioadenosine phosphorylase